MSRTHLITLGVHGFYLLLRLILVRRSNLAWFLFSLPALAIEIWFERIGRPKYVGEGSAKELKRAGEDLEAKGLTEWMWDVVYWTWGCVALTTVLGSWAWWLYVGYGIVLEQTLANIQPDCSTTIFGMAGMDNFLRSKAGTGWYGRCE